MAKVGRPTDYQEAYVAKAELYLKKYKKLGDVVPTIEGFADFIGSTKKTIYNWCKITTDNDGKEKESVASKEFLHAIDRIMNLQGKTLQNGSLKGTFNSTISKLLLSANHDMREKSDVTTNEKDIPAPIYQGKSS